MKIACLGYGVVGRGVAEILWEDSRFIIKRILVKESESCPESVKTTDYNEILNDDEIETVIEMMGGIDFAYHCIKSALLKKKHVVTSNKAVVAAHYRELIELAEKQGVQFRFEAAVGGGIPWIHTLLSQLRCGSVSKVEGIFNGTTNYIFDQMHTTHKEFDEVLKEAQNLGYAEADPSSDVDGPDMLRKLMISSSIAFKTVTDMESFTSSSMRTIQLADILYFEKQGYRCRYFASCFKEGDCYYGSVEPALFKETSLPAAVTRNNNIAMLEHDTLGPLQLIGQGAGRYPTANAVVSDAIDIFEGKEAKVEVSESLCFDDSLVLDSLCICASQEAIHCFDGDLLKTEASGNRVYGWTKPMSQKAKQQALAKAKEKDETLFYAVVR